MPRHLGIRSSLALTLLCSSTYAAGPSDSARGAARRLGGEGLEAYDKGDFEVALDKLNRAYEVVKIPSVGLWSARAMVKRGLLVQASERYLEISRVAIDKADKTQVNAQNDAVRERNDLLPRVPQLTIAAPGMDPETSEVTLDGERIAPALLGVASPVNPGEHRVLLKVNGEESWEIVTLRESESRKINLHLPSDTSAAPAPLPDASGTSAQSPTAKVIPTSLPPPSPEPRGRTQRSIGWVTLAVGGAGIATGTVAGLLALSRKSNMVGEGCTSEGHCYTDQEPDLNRYNLMRSVSTVGFIVGGVGLAAGATLLFTAPRETKTGSSVSGYVGVGSMGLVGSF
jgi:hypothetical protein